MNTDLLKCPSCGKSFGKEIDKVDLISQMCFPCAQNNKEQGIIELVPASVFIKAIKESLQ